MIGESSDSDKILIADRGLKLCYDSVKELLECDIAVKVDNNSKGGDCCNLRCIMLELLSTIGHILCEQV